MAVYAIGGQQTILTTTYKTAISVNAAASGTIRRGKVFDINVSQAAAPSSTDTNIIFDMSRVTSVGTNTAVTPAPGDPADAVFSGLAGQNHTIEPTGLTPSVFNIGLNQRAPYRWQTYLGSGAEIVYPATASNGLALRVQSLLYTASAGGIIYCQEQ